METTGTETPLCKHEWEEKDRIKKYDEWEYKYYSLQLCKVCGAARKVEFTR